MAEQFNVDVVESVDQDTVETSTVQFPIIQWHRGDPKMKKAGGMDYQGGWFIAENMAPADLEAYGWERTTWMHNNQEETEGFHAREIEISVIRERQRWEVWDGTRRLNYTWRDYDKASLAGRASGRTHVLCIVKGLESFGPFVLTLRGMASVHFRGSRHVKGALAKFDATVVRAANDAVRKAGKKGIMPRRAFWLAVGANRNAKGEPQFDEVGSGTDKSLMVIPVALGLPDKAEQVDLGQFFVGRELLDTTTQIYKDTETWAAAWDVIAPGRSDGIVEDETPAAEKVTSVTADVAEELGL